MIGVIVDWGVSLGADDATLCWFVGFIGISLEVKNVGRGRWVCRIVVGAVPFMLIRLPWRILRVVQCLPDCLSCDSYALETWD
jgi:hypothetical protein